MPAAFGRNTAKVRGDVLEGAGLEQRRLSQARLLHDRSLVAGLGARPRITGDRCQENP